MKNEKYSITLELTESQLETLSINGSINLKECDELSGIEYPIEAKFHKTDKVVKFYSRNTGKVIVGDNDHHVGFISSVWLDCTDSDIWKILEGGTKE